MTLYTRTGDDGTTGLFGGQRVRKDHARVEAYGNLDELNAAVGLALAACDPAAPASLRDILGDVQSHLFDVGADLATPAGSPHESKVHRFEARHVERIERWIDEIDGANEPMQSFILPGGTELAARLHMARTVCRRAERSMVALAATETITDAAIVYVNRVSDLLFAMARRANSRAGVPDVPWVPDAG
ncbi:MAG: cob(I)yrinic acid a,c-diamide adenosyltransferase [Planctomycetota bacterium]|jgi:cob(I)alamin adenosyltransferase